MNTETLYKDEMKVIGIYAEGSDIKEEGILQSYMLWGEYLGKNISDKIPNKINPNIHMEIFTYAGTGRAGTKFSLLIGTEVSSLETVPEGLVGITIPAGKYACFKLKGSMDQKIKETWQYIWNQWPKESGFSRAFTYDIEVMDTGKFYKGYGSEMEILVSIK